MKWRITLTLLAITTTTAIVVGVYFAFYAPLNAKTIQVPPAEYYTLVTALDAARERNGSHHLDYSYKLQASACYKAEEILANDNWAHDNKDGTKTWVWFDKAGYDYKSGGENLAKSFDTPDETVQAWLDSPAHRANLLSDRYTEQGVCERTGTLDGKPATVTVHHFGLPNDR